MSQQYSLKKNDSVHSFCEKNNENLLERSNVSKSEGMKNKLGKYARIKELSLCKDLKVFALLYGAGLFYSSAE